MNPTLCRFDLEHASKSGQGLTAEQALAVWALVESAEREAEEVREMLADAEDELQEAESERAAAERRADDEQATADSLQQTVEELERELGDLRSQQ